MNVFEFEIKTINGYILNLYIVISFKSYIFYDYWW